MRVEQSPGCGGENVTKHPGLMAETSDVVSKHVNALSVSAEGLNSPVPVRASNRWTRRAACTGEADAASKPQRRRATESVPIMMSGPWPQGVRNKTLTCAQVAGVTLTTGSRTITKPQSSGSQFGSPTLHGIGSNQLLPPSMVKTSQAWSG